jgi:branched-chain amino acid transport system substrate-binding protein
MLRIRRGPKVGAALAVGLLALAACGSGNDSASSSSSSAAAGGGEVTAEQIQWSLDLTHGTAGAADPSKSPVVLGFVNEQGGTLSFAEAEVAADATVTFINQQLGGIQGHPLELHKCLAAAPTDSQKCGQQMANDPDVKAIIVPLMLLNNQAFYDAISAKKPVLSGGLFFPIDLTTPNVYSYQTSSFSSAKGIAIFADKVLHAKRVIDVRTDNPAGLASSQVVHQAVTDEGLEFVDVPVPEPGTAPVYTSALRSANIKDGDVVSLGITSIGAVSVYDALKTLNLTSTPVLAGELTATPPLPGHLEDVGAKDTVFPDGWYLGTAGYTTFMPQPNSNGADAYVAMMGQYAPAGADLRGYAQVSFQEIMALTRFYNETGPEATSDQLSTSIKTWQGPAPLTAGPLRCGALPESPNLCQFDIGYNQRTDGKWVSVVDGLNGKAIDTIVGDVVQLGS